MYCSERCFAPPSNLTTYVFCHLTLQYLFPQAKAVSEATLKHCREALAALRKRCNALQKALQEDQSLHTANQAHVAEGLGAYEALQAHSKAAEAAVLAAQQHFQAVTAGLSSGAGGQEETLAAQKIGTAEQTLHHPGCSGVY